MGVRWIDGNRWRTLTQTSVFLLPLSFMPPTSCRRCAIEYAEQPGMAARGVTESAPLRIPEPSNHWFKTVAV